jgi:hypothetical protein
MFEMPTHQKISLTTALSTIEAAVAQFILLVVVDRGGGSRRVFASL